MSLADRHRRRCGSSADRSDLFTENESSQVSDHGFIRCRCVNRSWDRTVLHFFSSPLLGDHDASAPWALSFRSVHGERIARAWSIDGFILVGL